MTTGAIMAYSPVSTAVGAHFRGPLVDCRFGRVYDVGGTPDGLRYFDFYPNGNEIRVRSNADIGISGSSGPWTMCYNSQYFACVNGPSNGAAVFFMRSTDFTLVTTFGTADSSFTNSTTHIENPTCMVAIQNQYAGDIVICNTARTNGVLNAISVGGLNTVLGAVDENHTVLGAVPDGSGTVAYAIGFTKLGAATQIGLYRLTPGIVSVGKILPASIDPAWSHIDGVSGISIDQVDGNIIIGVTDNTDTPTHRAYLVKINVTTAAVMWAIPTGANINSDGLDDLKQNVITRSTLYYLSGGTTLLTINTATGAYVSSTLDTYTVGPLNLAQVSEDVTGSVVWYGAWTEGATHPAYLGSYCLTGGHHSGSNLIWRYFPGGAPSPAPTYAIPAQSRRRAWSYAADGHTFYVLDLGQEGTFVYDDLTQQWSKFITQAFNGWNLTNGTVWGQRIIGGDFLTGDIWEMQPAAGKDNGSVDIVHIVTGGLLVRGRAFNSVEAVNLAASVGQLNNTAGATVLLSFSDDQGQTWTDADTLALTEGAYSAEIAWRSLGAFASPGRVFRITDTGGFLRIDGCDASIANFDDTVPQQPQGS